MRETVLKTALADGQIALYYLGQVGFLVKWQEKYLLIDGYLSDCARNRRFPFSNNHMTRKPNLSWYDK